MSQESIVNQNALKIVRDWFRTSDPAFLSPEIEWQLRIIAASHYASESKQCILILSDSTRRGDAVITGSEKQRWNINEHEIRSDCCRHAR